MKKRILALALAGTTAFSVFGAAMSANAAWPDSTHDAWNIDRYESYVPAGPLEWTDASKDDGYGFSGVTYYVQEGMRPSTNADGQKYWPTTTTIYMAKSDIAKFNTTTSNNYANVKAIEDMTLYGTKDKIMSAMGYREVQGGNSSGYITIGKKTYYVGTQANAPQSVDAAYKLFPCDENGNVSEDIAAEYKPYGGTGFWIYINEDYVTKDKDGNVTGVDVSTAREVFVPTTNGTEMNKAMVKAIETYADQYDLPYYLKVDEANSKKDQVMTNLQSNANQNWYVLTSAGSNSNGIYNGMDYGKFDFTDPTDFDAVMANPVQPSGEVYLYDYYGELPNGISADTFEYAYNNKRIGQLLSSYNNDASKGVLNPDAGRYGAKGVRVEVVDAWENFLDDLGIADASTPYLTAWAKDTLENYLYQYYDANVITYWNYNETKDTWEVHITSGKNVDLYNFEGLIKDILELAPAWKVNTAQTSEMVYLMQQYDKYMDGYVDPVPVETDEWGDLLVSLAQAPTEDEFATANAYKRYTNKAEDLVEAYEEADTAAAVKLAETNLFNFVSSYTSAYKYETKGNATELGNAIGSATFNYNWSATSFDVDAKNEFLKDTDGKYSPENYIGAFDKDGDLGNYGRVEAGIGKTGLGSYALYPIGDYEGSVNDGAYPGVDQKIYGVTQEYFWFYNVYNLAYNVYTGNKYQSVLDLMATTLNDAIDALVPSDNASASEILGAEEEAENLADLVDTDYKDGMWANRNKIYTYITDRVSNDEIGSYGSTNAEEIAAQVAEQLGYQNYQTTTTRSDINRVSTAKAEAQAALKALQADEDNYNAAQANALEKAIEDCDYIIDLYNGDYSKSPKTQSVDGKATMLVGDKDQILKSDCDKAVEAVDSAINFSKIIMGWSQDKDGNWMYGTENGYLNDGWHQVDGGKTWFYFNEDGTAKQSEWWQDPATGTWYWFNSNCGAAVGWAKIDGDWYYFKGNNAMKTGWEKVEGSWYYMNSSGKMVTGWCQINGTWYYFSKESNALGQMLANTTTPDGYKVDANGALVE